MKAPPEEPRCPFCYYAIEQPRELATRKIVEFPIGVCEHCGAVYVYDVTGHNMGSAFIEALLFSCNEDDSLAFSLSYGDDYTDAVVGNYDIITHTIVAEKVLNDRYVKGVLIFLKLFDQFQDPVLRTFTVFNVDQVDGESVDHLRASTEPTPEPLHPDYAAAREAISATNADIRFGGDRAFYARPIGEWPNHHGGDFIQMPHPGQFIAPNEFISTTLHELVHWSEVRLGWTGSYAMGELIAEIGACFSTAQLGVPCSDDLSNHTAYLSSWLKALENDPKAILKAASQASQATSFILGFKRATEPQPDDLQAV